MEFAKVKKEQEREGGKMKKLGRFLKAFFGVVCVIYVATFIWLAIYTRKAEMVLGAVLFAVPAYFLLRKKKVKPEPQGPTAGARPAHRAPGGQPIHAGCAGGNIAGYADVLHKRADRE